MADLGGKLNYYLIPRLTPSEWEAVDNECILVTVHLLILRSISLDFAWISTYLFCCIEEKIERSAGTWNNLPYNQLFRIRGIEFFEKFGSPPQPPLITE